jgi:hypothetical protein
VEILKKLLMNEYNALVAAESNGKSAHRCMSVRIAKIEINTLVAMAGNGKSATQVYACVDIENLTLSLLWSVPARAPTGVCLCG